MPTQPVVASASPGGGEHLTVARHHVGDVTLVHREVTLALGPLGLDAREPRLTAGHARRRASGNACHTPW